MAESGLLLKRSESNNELNNIEKDNITYFEYFNAAIFSRSSKFGPKMSL